MSVRQVVIDGSNIATEGRSLPSLVQLEEAVAEYHKEFPDDELIVIVDATFGHRIDESERPRFDDAVAHNEVVSPPAGAIGRGDAFLLRVADKVGGTVLSNDSFQEFHGEYEWLFHNGRLVGGKPVPGVGWIFTPRTPVRGPRSRMSVADARKKARSSKADVQRQRKRVEQAIAVATDEAVEPARSSPRRRRRSRGGAPPAEPVNEPLTFIQFVAGHKLGSSVSGEVEGFSSHGAFVVADGARCYIPLSALADPPPRAARDVLRRGESREFVVQALDAPRRGIELALPGLARVAGEPTAETVEAEIHEAAPPPAKKAAKPAAKKPAAKKPAAKKAAKKAAAEQAPAAEVAGTKAPPKKAAATKAGPGKVPAEKATPKKAAAKKTTAAKATPKKAAAKKTAAKKAAGKKAAAKKAAAKKTAAKKARGKTPAGKAALTTQHSPGDLPDPLRDPAR